MRGIIRSRDTSFQTQTKLPPAAIYIMQNSHDWLVRGLLVRPYGLRRERAARVSLMPENVNLDC